MEALYRHKVVAIARQISFVDLVLQLLVCQNSSTVFLDTDKRIGTVFSLDTDRPKRCECRRAVSLECKR